VGEKKSSGKDSEGRMKRKGVIDEGGKGQKPKTDKFWTTHVRSFPARSV